MDRWRSSDLQPRPRAGTDVCKHKKSSRRRKPSAFGDRKRRVQTEICPSTHASEPLPATPRPILRLKAAETAQVLTRPDSQGSATKLSLRTCPVAAAENTALTRQHARLHHCIQRAVTGRFHTLSLRVLIEGRPRRWRHCSRPLNTLLTASHEVPRSARDLSTRARSRDTLLEPSAISTRLAEAGPPLRPIFIVFITFRRRRLVFHLRLLFVTKHRSQLVVVVNNRIHAGFHLLEPVREVGHLFN